MKLTLTFLLFAVSAFAEVELSSRYENQECIINSKSVTRRVTFEGKGMGFTTTKGFAGYGYEELARKAAALSTNRTSPSIVQTIAKIDGVTYIISREDSKEAGLLIGFIGSACN